MVLGRPHSTQEILYLDFNSVEQLGPWFFQSPAQALLLCTWLEKVWTLMEHGHTAAAPKPHDNSTRRRAIKGNALIWNRTVGGQSDCKLGL